MVALLLPLSVTGCFFYPEALRLVVESARPDVSVLSLCEKGDAFIMAETGKVFKKEKEMKKGESNIAPVSLIYFGVNCFGPFKKKSVYAVIMVV